MNSRSRIYCDRDFQPRRWWQQRRIEAALNIAAASVLITFLLLALAFARAI